MQTKKVPIKTGFQPYVLELTVETEQEHGALMAISGADCRIPEMLGKGCYLRSHATDELTAQRTLIAIRNAIVKEVK